MDFIRLNEHITLSEITPKDIDSFVEFLNEKEIYINTLTIPFPYTKENSEWFVSFVKKNKKEHGRIINWAIRNKEEKLIGVVGFDNGIDGHKAEIGLSRITANVFEQNIGSARVVEKCGFTLEAACLKNYYKKDGKLYAKTI